MRCLTGKLVDVTKSYKYMYFCCGAIVILASIWLFIGNFINYKLLAREKQMEEQYNRTNTDDPDRDTEEKALEETVGEKIPNNELSVQRETNI